MNPEEEQLVKEFHQIKTQKRAFEMIVRRYSRPLFSHLSRYVNQKEDIEDILQIVWLKAWRGLSKFRGDSLLSTWLFTIATREAYNFYRSRKPLSEEIVEQESQFHKVNNSDWTMDAHEILNTLQVAIDQLPKKQKEVFVMRYFEEITYEEMSQKTGTSEGALKASYHHAVKKIEAFIRTH